MSTLTPEQERTRERFEGLIRLMAPALDAILYVGERVSRLGEPEDYEHYPVRPVGDEVRSPIGGSPPDGPDDSHSTVG